MHDRRSRSYTNRNFASVASKAASLNAKRNSLGMGRGLNELSVGSSGRLILRTYISRGIVDVNIVQLHSSRQYPDCSTSVVTPGAAGGNIVGKRNGIAGV